MQKVINHPITIIIFTVVAVIFYFSLEKSAKTAQNSVSSLEEVHQETEKLRSDVAILKNELSQAESPLAKEKIIRNELLLQKPGEYVIQLPEFSQVESSTPEIFPQEAPWSQWKEILL